MTDQKTKTNKPKKTTKKWYKKVVKAVAFLLLFTMAAYGCRQLLATLQEPVAYGITAFFMAALLYILFDK